MLLRGARRPTRSFIPLMKPLSLQLDNDNCNKPSNTTTSLYNQKLVSIGFWLKLA